MTEDDRATRDFSTVPGLSDSEKQLLSEYQRLSLSLKTLSQSIHRLAAVPTPQILEMMRTLESKTALVSTLLKASVYSMFVQNEDDDYVAMSEDQFFDQGDVMDVEADYTATDGY